GGGVVLDGSVDGHPGAREACAYEGGSVAHLVDFNAGAGLTGGVGEHGDAGFDAELGGGADGRDGDVGELCNRGVGDDGAVAVDEHAVGEGHEEDAGDDGDAG